MAFRFDAIWVFIENNRILRKQNGKKREKVKKTRIDRAVSGTKDTAGCSCGDFMAGTLTESLKLQ